MVWCYIVSLRVLFKAFHISDTEVLVLRSNGLSESLSWIHAATLGMTFLSKEGATEEKCSTFHRKKRARNTDLARAVADRRGGVCEGPEKKPQACSFL